MLHKLFTRWLCTLHNIILAHHDENCECECAFCTSCGDLDTLSIGAFLRLCCAHHLFVFMGLPSLCLTGIVSITSMIAFPCLFTFELFDQQFFFCLCPFIQLWFVPLQQAWKSVWMSCVSFTLWWGRGGVLDVWAGWSYWTICFQCGYWLHHARSNCSSRFITLKLLCLSSSHLYNFNFF